MKILNVGYRSVNCFLLITQQSKLLIDVGWPGGMQELKASLARHSLSIKDVTHVLVTHYHMDHGALAQEVKDKGAKLIVMENQSSTLNHQKKFIRPPSVFHEIRPEGNILLNFKDSNEFLAQLGIHGRIIPTPGHGPDHVTLVLDEGIAFTGDLPPENGSPEGSDAQKDWHTLRSMNVKRVYPAHGAVDISLDQ